MDVLVVDALPDFFSDAATRAGHRLTVRPGVGPDDLLEHIAGFDALVVRSTAVTAAIEAADRLSLIVRAGAGTNTIDVGAASGKAITVSNVPGRNAIAVAELTVGLMLAIDRAIADNVAELRGGSWAKKRFGRAKGLFGRTFGIVGLGAIGREVVRRVAAFGMPIITPRRTHSASEVDALIDQLRIEQVDSMSEFLGRADVISLHLPLNESTRGMVDADFLSRMKEGATLLNTARGELIQDEAVLIEAVEQRHLWLGLDVYHDEPPSGSAEFHSPLARHPRVYGTHHIGASTDQAQAAVAAGVLDVLNAHESGRALHAVNLVDAAGSARLVVRHLNRVGVLSAMLSHLREAGINVENMENRIFAGAEGAVARLSLSATPGDATVRSIQSSSDVIDVTVSDQR